MIHGKASWFVITRDIGCKFVAFSILLRTWRYTQRFLLSLFYSALSMPPYFLWYVFGNFWKTGQNISVFESGYSRSYFNLFLIYVVTCNVHKYKPTQNINSSKLTVQKIKTFHWSFFSLKNLTRKCSCFRCMCEWSLLCFSRNKSFLEILLSGEYKKCWFLKTQDSVFAFWNSIRSRLEYCSGFVSSHNAS